MCVRARCAMARLTLPWQEDSVRPPAQLLRNAAIGGGEALLSALGQLARTTRHPELADAGVLLWGFSAAGSFGPTFAQWQPDRTIGFIRYHSHLRNVPVDVHRITSIPALLIAGAADSIAGFEDAEQAWRAGRAVNAPYALVIHPRQGHVSVDGLLDASYLMRGWIEEVLRARRPVGASARATSLRTVERNAGWLADGATGEIARYSEFRGDVAAANWLPDEATALEWVALRGACTAISASVLARALGEGARRTEERSTVCEYTRTADGAVATLWLGLGRFASVREAQEVFDNERRQESSTPLEGMESRAFVRVDARQNCRVVVAHRATFLIRTVRCGSGHDSETARRALSELTGRLAGRG
jgi:hypothetical protein